MAQAPHLSAFLVAGVAHPVAFVKSQRIALGVTCDVYAFVDAEEMDLGIIHLAAGTKTPLQRVVSGTKTVEGFVDGDAVLLTRPSNTRLRPHRFTNETASLPVHIPIGG